MTTLDLARDIIDAFCKETLDTYPSATMRDKLATDLLALSSLPAQAGNGFLTDGPADPDQYAAYVTQELKRPLAERLRLITHVGPYHLRNTPNEAADALAPSQPAAVGEGENAFAGYEGVTAKELAETVARYGKALSQIDRSWAAAVSGASTDIPNITGWTGSLDNYGQIFAWVARAALRSTP